MAKEPLILPILRSAFIRFCYDHLKSNIRIIAPVALKRDRQRAMYTTYYHPFILLYFPVHPCNDLLKNNPTYSIRITRILIVKLRKLYIIRQKGDKK